MIKEMEPLCFQPSSLVDLTISCWAKFVFGVIMLKEFDIIRLKESPVGMRDCHLFQT